jgi:hypothetical protein
MTSVKRSTIAIKLGETNTKQKEPNNMCTALQIRCQNPECKTPLLATPRYVPDSSLETYVFAFFACDTCFALKQGPPEHQGMPEYCGKCQSFFGWEPCKCRIDYLYGGPIVVCDQCHKQTVWLDSRSGTGFAGGSIHLDTFSCGHNIMDES